MVKSRMTIEKLAEMTQQEFSNVYKRFDGVDERFDGVDERLNQLQAGQERLENGLQRVLDVVLEIPSKKAFERTQTRNEARFVVIEKRLVFAESRSGRT